MSAVVAFCAMQCHGATVNELNRERTGGMAALAQGPVPSTYAALRLSRVVRTALQRWWDAARSHRVIADSRGDR